MAQVSNNSISFTSGFVDETSVPTDIQLDEHTALADRCISDPLLVEADEDGTNLSTNFQEESNPKVQEDNLEIESSTRLQEDSLEIEPSTKFEKNSLVFAKLSGHIDPPWPARVAKVCWKNDVHFGYEVFFYGTYQVGIVLTDKVWAYGKESISKFSKPKIASMRKRGDFSRGLTEIRDRPDIAPSRDIQESASQIAKKLIRSSAINDRLKSQRKRVNDFGEAAATSTPDRINRKARGGKIDEGMASKRTTLKKIKDKNITKPSSWILSTLSKLDNSNDIDNEGYPSKKMKFPSNNENLKGFKKNIARRSKRVKKFPGWRSFEDNNNEAVGQHENTLIKSTNVNQNIPLGSQCKPNSTYPLRNKKRSIASKEIEDNADANYSPERIEASRQADCLIVKEEPLSGNPLEWTVAQTFSSVIKMDPSLAPEDIRPIREHKIDGSALLQLSFHDFIIYCQIKVGPAVKLSNIVKTLQANCLNSETNNDLF